ncbi:MAG TPA: DsbA family protein [Steroidobacteraceae bacterium]|nr:DsbA family protein [Steroidobacteraceae bacterium]
MNSNLQSVRRWLQVAVLALLANAWLAGAAAAQDVAIITRAGQKEMLKNPGTPPAGANNPDVVIVEYFDYNCPYCKKIVPTLQSLLAQDPKIAVVYKDWPILGPVSVYAASAALAAGYQGKYLAAHDALISGPRLAKDEQVDGALQKAGVNMDSLAKDRTAHAAEIAALLKRNDEEAHALTLEGTPGVVVGRQLVAGIADTAMFTKLIANSRKGK